MVRQSSMVGWSVALGTILLAGCSNLPDWSLFGPLHQDEPALATAGNYDFSWRLSGDQRAGPLQVFDDGRHTWLQFAPGQPIPAVFVRTAQGDRLLNYQRQEPYVRLDGVWPVLVLRAGGLESLAERLTPTNSLHKPSLHQPSHAEVQAVAPDPVSAAQEPSMAVAPAEAASLGAVSSAVAASAASLTPAADALSSADTSSAAVFADDPFVHVVSPVRVQPPYQVSPQDGNIRLVLARWATSSGWTFETEHWAVDVDIPIVGSAAFELEFDEAVQQLLASTELSDRPLQPCFYANKVLRVVPYAQSCDRTASLERA